MRPKMKPCAEDSGGGALVFSQFTLAADMRSGKRPAFHRSPTGCGTSGFICILSKACAAWACAVETGQFGAEMAVHLLNERPVPDLVWTLPRPELRNKCHDRGT